MLDAHPDAVQPLDALAAFGGFEIATMTGAMLQAAAERRVILVDGVIVSSALLVASRIAPQVLQRCVYAHRSGEPGHQLILDALHARPLLDWGMRLGEGSGAVIAWPLLESACVMLSVPRCRSCRTTRHCRVGCARDSWRSCLQTGRRGT